jgi:hypothetical protein
VALLGWDHIKSEDGYEVYRRHSGLGPSSRFASVKCHGVVNAPAEDVLALFQDNSRYVVSISFYELSLP